MLRTLFFYALRTLVWTGNSRSWLVACSASNEILPESGSGSPPAHTQRSLGMPNSLSAKKALRKNQARRLQNRQQRSQLRNELKKFRTLMEASPSRDEADKAFDQVKRSLDKAAAKRLIHRNVASRTKSRLSALKKSVCS